MTIETIQTTRKAWGYAESFMIAFELLILGFAIEVLSGGNGLSSPRMPYNLIVLFAYVILTVVLHIYYRQNRIVKWLSSVPASISAISVYALLVLLLGFIPQGKSMHKIFELLGFNHLKNSWPFILIEIYVISSLGLVILRRTLPLSGRNIGFFLNHFGLWLTLVTAGLGSGDLKRLSLDLFVKGDFTNLASDGKREIYSLPFSMKLLDFQIFYYNPKIAIADSKSGEIIRQHGEVLPLIEKGKELKMEDWNIKVTQLIPYALKSDTGYYASNEPGTAAAAYIIATKAHSRDSVKGWLCSGSMRSDPKYIYINRDQILFISAPEPKKFQSKVVIKNLAGNSDTIMLEVNKPHSEKGWKLYQMSYDETMGKDSQVSIIEAVHDPWLPVVYVGVFCLIAGSLYLFWKGGTVRAEDISPD
jgi:ResB-like family